MQSVNLVKYVLKWIKSTFLTRRHFFFKSERAFLPSAKCVHIIQANVGKT